MRKQILHLNENQLNRIIKTSIKKILKESFNQFTDSEGVSMLDNNNDIDEKYGELDGIWQTNNFGIVKITDYNGYREFKGENFDFKGEKAISIANYIANLIHIDGMDTSSAISYALNYFINTQHY